MAQTLSTALATTPKRLGTRWMSYEGPSIWTDEHADGCLLDKLNIELVGEDTEQRANWLCAAECPARKAQEDE
jgi:hypothetical protein